MDLGVEGQNFIVFGGSRGMGFAAARALAQEGARVYILSRNPVVAASEMAEAEHGSIVSAACDVTDELSVDTVFANIVADCGRVHGISVTNYAGARSPPFHEMTRQDWNARYEDVYMGSIRPCASVIPHMIQQGGGAIVLTSAFSALNPGGSLSAYASFKAGLINLTQNLARTYGAEGIRANVVCPGYIRTGRAEQRAAEVLAKGIATSEEVEQRLIADISMNIAMNRLGEAAEVGDTIAFLLSARSGYTSGAVVSIDGAARP